MAKKTRPTRQKREDSGLSPLEQARLAQFKRIFPRECALLIAEYEAQKTQETAND